jgi:CRISPR-associated protein Cmr3
LVRVVRKDDGNGKKSIYQQHWHGKQWVNSLDNINRENIPIYRYREIKQAIANGESIFIVEGEGKADLLWSMGLPATCNLAGSKKWRPSDTQDLEGASVILCPDRDAPGIEHCEAIARDFPNAQWVYCFPDSPLWNHLPESRGADLKDWIDEGATKDDIIKGIGEKKPLKPQKTEKPNNVVSHPKFSPKPLETDKLGETIDNLISQSVIGSRLKIELTSIAKQYGISDQRINEIYKERLNECDQDLDREDIFSDLDSILKADSQRLDLSKVLPEKLAAAIGHHARLTGLRGEAYLTALLSGLSSTLHPDTALSLYPQTNWKVPPNLYAAIVALSGEGKSIIGRAMISDPLKALIELDDQDYEAKLNEYKAALADYESLKKSKNTDSYPDGPPSKPTRRIRYFSSGTGEGIARYAAGSSDKGMLLFKDEIAGLFKSANQYRGGRGSDSENLLEYFDGTPPVTLRADPDKTVICRKILLSIYGTIQPAILEKLLGDKEDSSGQWARFIFCQLPPSNLDLDIDAAYPDLTPMLTDLYRQFDRLPVKTYDLSRPARERFLKAANRLKSLSENEQRPAMRNVLIKARGLIGRLALNLHLANSLFNGITPPLEIGKEIVNAAIELVSFFINQVRGMYGKLSDDLPSAYARLLSVATDWITPNNARKKAFNTKTRQDLPTTRIAEIFKELADQGYGEVRKTARSIEFKSLKGDKGDSKVTKGDSLVTPLEPLPDKDFNLKGDKGDSKNHFAVKTTNPLSEDHTVTPHNLKGDKLLNSESPLSPLPPLDGETQSQQGFTKGDYPDNTQSPLVTPVTFSESPQSETVINELSADGVHIDSLPDPEKERVLVRNTRVISIGSNRIRPKTIGEIIEVGFDDQWVAKVKIEDDIIPIPFNQCLVKDITPNLGELGNFVAGQKVVIREDQDLPDSDIPLRGQSVGTIEEVIEDKARVTGFIYDSGGEKYTALVSLKNLDDADTVFVDMAQESGAYLH